MIKLDLEQGTEEWHRARLGIPTASMMDKIITPTGKASTQANGYMNQLLADWLAGHPVDAFESNRWTDQGHEREDQARTLYELVNDVDVEQTGFVFLDGQRNIGCSPDGLVGENGLLEIKNPKGSVFVEYLLDGKLPNKYKPQVQAQLWICGREWCDFMFHHPELGHKIIRVDRDDDYIALMAELVAKFIGKLLSKRTIIVHRRVSDD